ncbi:glycosyltransferase family 2 protein [Chromobacterium sinusclupearum]|uniref:glycosyltransferase family 2 protein n=1 Tax=Chromobacterium sinusclupearum TaxID=2077146 RepID=UPI0013048CB1|nr:glycosyltransferase family A protein [Chromobacterium sinusclupearum]
MISCKAPLVSVIVPSYNHQDYIEDCINSIFNQTYENFEVIVIDDGSNDNTVSKLQALQERYQFTLVVQENIGLAATLNKGISEYAGGDYIAFCASDDYWLPEKLQKQVDFMTATPNAYMCFGKAIAIDEHGKELESKTLNINNGLKGGMVFEDIILMKFHPPVNQMFKKEVFKLLGLYPVGLWTEDLYMNLKICREFEIGYIPEFISAYRIPSNSVGKFITTRIADSHKTCIDLYKDSQYYPQAIKDWHYRNLIWYSSFKAHKIRAIRSLFYCWDYFYKISYLKSIAKIVLIWR